jgi:hypothetical protein
MTQQAAERGGAGHACAAWQQRHGCQCRCLASVAELERECVTSMQSGKCASASPHMELLLESSERAMRSPPTTKRRNHCTPKVRSKHDGIRP